MGYLLSLETRQYFGTFKTNELNRTTLHFVLVGPRKHVTAFRNNLAQH